MQFVAVLNRDGGTLRTTDLGAFADRLEKVLGKGGHTVDVRVVSGRQIEYALAKAASDPADVVMAGGGDGTISAAASALMHSKKALAVLPAGTMNLFARSLGIPLSLDAAIEAFVNTEVSAVDIASANGRPFVHQFSVGMHAKMVDMREKMQFRSRLGKLRASMKAATAALLNPPILKATLEVDGREIPLRATNIGITNNLFGEGHLPYADDPDGGVLGVYATIASKRGELFRAAYDVWRGRWNASSHVDVYQGEKVVLRLRLGRRKAKCVIDGELLPLEAETVFSIYKKALRVLVPCMAAANGSTPAKPEPVAASG